MELAQVLRELFVGSHPQTIDDIERLRRLAVTAVLNLQTDEDMASVGLVWQPLEEHYKTAALHLVRLPVKEEQTEMAAKFSLCVSTLNELLSSENHTVYLHCTAGIARSPTVAIGHLHWSLGWEWDEAIARLKQVRGKCSPHLDALRLSMSARQANHP